MLRENRVLFWLACSGLWIALILGFSRGYAPLWESIAPAFGEPYPGFNQGQWPPYECAGPMDADRSEVCLEVDRSVAAWRDALDWLGLVAFVLAAPPIALLGFVIWPMRDAL